LKKGKGGNATVLIGTLSTLNSVLAGAAVSVAGVVDSAVSAGFAAASGAAGSTTLGVVGAASSFLQDTSKSMKNALLTNKGFNRMGFSFWREADFKHIGLHY